MLLPLLLLSFAFPQQPLQTRAGDATLTLGGEVMGRVELRDDADLSTPMGESEDPMRARGALHLDVDYGAYLHAFAEVMGSWGDTGESTTEDLQQLYLDMDQLLGDWRLRLGRTELDYGDGSLVASNRRWLFEPNSFDGLVVGGDSERRDVAWSAWMTRGANGPADAFDDDFAGIYASFGLTRETDVEAYFLKRDQDALGVEEYTLAARWFGTTLHGLDWSVFGALQDGRSAGTRETWAQALILRLGKEIDGGHHVGLEFSVATGNDSRARDFKRYTPVYMDQHEFNGRADLFAFSNLMDLGFLYGMQWNERWAFHLDFHSFWRQSRVDDAFEAYSMAPYGIASDSLSLGQEVDVYAESKLAEGLAIDFGAAYFLAASALPADDDQLWLFAAFAFLF